ncbi:MAG: hypothetical protein CMN28_06540 [Salinisphaeraceae bacterium]|jgi:Flp pilus assembly protein TadG|nr:hypothetical protein [Salinisphaeraceae bacterium]
MNGRMRAIGVRQSGAAMIEFALVLPILLLIVVGTIYYGYVFVIEMALENAAQEAAVAAAAIQPADYETQAQYLAAVDAVVDRVAEDNLDWLPVSVRSGFSSDVASATNLCFVGSSCDGDSSPCAGATLPTSGQLGCVTIDFALSTTDSAVLPRLNLPPFGQVPPLPGNLSGVAQVVL